jgi:hypothetical protein
MRPATRIVNAVALALSVYGFAGWLYVAVISLVTPQTLPMRLTHLANWPRTDTFGAFCFAMSFVAFIAYQLTRGQRVTRNGR